MFFINKLHSLVVIVIVIRTLKFSKCQFEGNVVGGIPTTAKKYPHSIFLNAECQNTWWICGSSVLNQKILLTAAHCVAHCNLRRGDTIHTIGGHEHLKQKAVSRKIIEIKVHNTYIEHRLFNDIAVVKVNKNLPLGATIKRVIIAVRQYPRPKLGSVAGWGITNEQTLKPSDVLIVVKQRVSDRKTCSQIPDLHSGNFCAEGLGTEQSHPSAGDSGSAMITAEYQQIGLVSFRMPNLPALMVYTNVTYYYNWISANSVKIFCKG